MGWSGWIEWPVQVCWFYCRFFATTEGSWRCLAFQRCLRRLRILICCAPNVFSSGDVTTADSPETMTVLPLGLTTGGCWSWDPPRCSFMDGSLVKKDWLNVWRFRETTFSLFCCIVVFQNSLVCVAHQCQAAKPLDRYRLDSTESSLLLSWFFR